MNRLIPKYSFINLFLPYAKNYKYNIGVNIDSQNLKYDDLIIINNLKIKTSINIKEDYNKLRIDESNNSYNITTNTEFNYTNNNINESININLSNNLFKIDYNLKNNNNIIEKIDIPIFEIVDYNYDILLQHYHFLDNKSYNLYREIQKNINKL